MRTSAFFATVILMTALCLATSAHPGEEAPEAVTEIVRNTVDDPVLDRNGDGFQDTIVEKRKVHYDVDFDGRFDYTLTLKFEEHTTEGHRKYLGSSCSKDVFAELMEEGLDRLCQDERREARWLEDNFSTFYFYRDGYGLLSILTDDPWNDGRLADRKHKGKYAYIVSFNPDGTVKTVRRGSDKVKLAAFDFETSTASGRKVLLPRIESIEDLDRMRAEIDHLFEGG